MPSCLQWNYSGDPSTSDLDYVRFRVGDTIPTDPLVDDREIQAMIAQEVNLLMAAASIAEHLAARFARKVAITVGPVSKGMDKLAESYRQLAKDLKKEAYSSGALPSFPATKVADKEALQQDDTLTKPNFEIGMFDNPRSVQFDDGISDRDGEHY